MTIKVATKDHWHYTNRCCLCHKTKNDAEIRPVWVDRISGLIPKVYAEPDYACRDCLDDGDCKE